MWEIFTLGSVPYEGLSWGQEFTQSLEQEMRLENPINASNDWFGFLFRILVVS